jgi:FkbM family methyltransferase
MLRLPPPLQNGLFELALRAVTVSAGRCTTEPIRFALNELLPARRVRRYTVRRSRQAVFVRHPVADAWVVHEVFNRRVYEPPPAVGRALAGASSPRIVDLGAHVGAATLFFLQRFPAATVLALEPDPQNAALLRRTIEANGLHGQCELRQAAAGVAAGNATIEGFSLLAHLARDGSEEAVDQLPVLRKYQAGADSAPVEVVDVVPLIGGADLVKMDIEGSEWPILEDPRFRASGISAVVVEYHPQGAPEADTTSAVRRLLREADLVVGEPFQQNGPVGLLWGWRE